MLYESKACLLRLKHPKIYEKINIKNFLNEPTVLFDCEQEDANLSFFMGKSKVILKIQGSSLSLFRFMGRRVCPGW